MKLHQNGDSSTCVVEPPIELQDVSPYLQRPQDAKTAPSLKISDRKSQDDDPVESLPSPTTQAAEKLERWNQSRTNVYRTFAAFWSFVVMGSNDAAYGALIPYVRIPPSAPTQKSLTRTAARVLPPKVPNRFPRLPLAADRLHCLGPAQQHNPLEIRATRRRRARSNLPPNPLHRHRRAPALPRSHRHFLHRRLR